MEQGHEFYYLTPSEVAVIMDVNAETIVRWIKRGGLPAVRTPGGRYRIARQDVVLALKPAREKTDARAGDIQGLGLDRTE